MAVGLLGAHFGWRVLMSWRNSRRLPVSFRPLCCSVLAVAAVAAVPARRAAGALAKATGDPGITGTSGVDTFALIFQQLGGTSRPLTATASYTVFAADPGTRGTGFGGPGSGNAGDFFTGMTDTGQTFRVPAAANISPS